MCKQKSRGKTAAQLDQSIGIKDACSNTCFRGSEVLRGLWEKGIGGALVLLRSSPPPLIALHVLTDMRRPQRPTAHAPSPQLMLVRWRGQYLNLPIPQLNGQTKLLLRKWESASVTSHSESPVVLPVQNLVIFTLLVYC